MTYSGAARRIDELLESAHEEPTVNWARIERLLASCEKRSPSYAPANLSLGDYEDVLARYNGLEEFLGSETYLQLWKAEDIVRLNAAYHVEDFAPE